MGWNVTGDICGMMVLFILGLGLVLAPISLSGELIPVYIYHILWCVDLSTRPTSEESDVNRIKTG